MAVVVGGEAAASVTAVAAVAAVVASGAALVPSLCPSLSSVRASRKAAVVSPVKATSAIWQGGGRAREDQLGDCRCAPPTHTSHSLPLLSGQPHLPLTLFHPAGSISPPVPTSKVSVTSSPASLMSRISS